MSPRPGTVDLGPIVRRQVDALGIPVVGEVLAERARQDVRWGEQNHPDISPGIRGREPLDHAADAAEYYELPLADDARQRVDQDTRDGEGSWVAIATEELAEAVEAAALGDEAAVRTEVIQLAAVCVQWAQAIDRRKAAGATR